MRKGEIISRAQSIHGSKYSYDLIQSDYKSKDKIQIICHKHGVYTQTVAEHLRGSGCKLCFHERMKTTDFIDKAISIHGDKYDYSKVNYINMNTKVEIICSKHGSFQQQPAIHLQGSGCPLCYTDNNIDSLEKFIFNGNIIHNNKYDYSKVVFDSMNDHVIIICPLHGEYKQKPRNHIKSKAGCPTCAKQSQLLSHIEFVERAKSIHSNKYDYSQSVYGGALNEVVIVCPIHGNFSQIASNHLSGAGCPSCAHDITRSNTTDFINKAIIVHGDRFDYSNVVYKSAFDKVEIICHDHGSFLQKPNNHLNGQGCPKCHYSITSGHKRIISFMPPDIQIINNDRSTIHPYEIDIFIPSYNVGIEYHGNYWHSEHRANRSYDKFKCTKKHELASAKNIKLAQFYEFELLYKENIIRSMILHYLNRSNKIHARLCSLHRMSEIEATSFFESSHLSGHRSAGYYYGLVYNNDIMAAISMSKHHKYQWEIIRFAVKPYYSVAGGFSRLLSHFIKNHNPTQILTFADRRHSLGNLYNMNGFKLCGYTKPNYRYIDFKTKNILSRQQCQKHKLHRLLGDNFDESKSESANMIDNGYGRLWDAGHYKFLWSK